MFTAWSEIKYLATKELLSLAKYIRATVKRAVRGIRIPA